MARHEQIAVGMTRGAAGEESLQLPLSTLCRHALVTGSTGWGKSGFLLSILLKLLTAHPGIGVVLVDAKGETAELLRDRFLPLLAQRHPHLAASRVSSLQLFGRFGSGLNPLCRIPGLPIEVQANLLCSQVDGLVDGGLGPRMRGILAWLARAVIEVGGGLHDLIHILNDDDYREAIARRVRDPEVRDYLLSTFATEPKASRDSLRARLEWLLLLPAMRGMLCAPTCLRGSDLLESGITVVDLGGAPQGMAPLSRFVGSFVFSLLTGAVFSRPVQPDTRPVILAVDEWQTLLPSPGAAEDFERLLSQARYRKVGLWLCNQAAAQIDAVSSSLTRSLITNIALHVAFRPDLGDIKHLLPLLPITGRRVNPQLPDQLLTKDQERTMLLDALTRLPPRHALLGDMVSGQARVIRTLSVPFERARREAEQLDPATIEQFRRGRFGVPVDQLAATPVAVSDGTPEAPEVPNTTFQVLGGGQDGAQAQTRERRASQSPRTPRKTRSANPGASKTKRSRRRRTARPGLELPE